MADDIPSILSHISIGTNDFERAVGFYDKRTLYGIPTSPI